MPDGMLGLRGTPVLTVPNLITLARLCAVPFAVWLVLRGHLAAAFALFVAAAVSDALDGWLARRGGGSPLGAMLDPAADKLLLVCMFVTLAAVQVLPDWIAILVVFRDVLIVGGVVLLWLTGAPPRIRPILVSKVNTALQLVLVGAALAWAAFGEPGAVVVSVLVWATAATTVASGAAYVAGRVR